MRRRGAARLAKLEQTVRELAELRQRDEEMLREVIVADVRRLKRRVTALEQHIVAFGPKVQRSDMETPGDSRWEEPYRPPE